MLGTGARLLLAGTTVFVVGCAPASTAASSSATPATSGPSPSATPATTPRPSSSPVRPGGGTAGWVPYTNVAGQFTVRHPAGWSVNPCSVDADPFLAYVILDSTVSCGDGREPSWILLTASKTDPGSQFSGNFNTTGTSTVTVAGVAAVRRTGLSTAVGLAPPAGSTAVEYSFHVHGMYYTALWTHYPTDKDNPADFDLMVTSTFRATGG